MERTYSELIRFHTLKERFDYLKLGGRVGEDTFGFDRYLNQIFYRSSEWKTIRQFVILRDVGNELGLEGYPITGKIYIHHMNPITPEDIYGRSEHLLDPKYLISVSLRMHNAITYGDDSVLDYYIYNERTPNDTCPWKNGKLYE